MSGQDGPSSKDLYLEEKHRFIFEVEKINEQLAQDLKASNHEFPVASPEIIEKSNDINRDVEKLLSNISAGKGQLLAAKSNAINKMISLVEITKSIAKKDHISIHQYNKLLQQSSLNNPNYSYSRMTQRQKENLTNELKPKVFILPLLFVYIAPEPVEMVDWTFQE